MGKEIKAILFDSGRVLNGPVTGHWHITPNFFTSINKKQFYSIARGQRDIAFSKAGEYMDKQKFILNEEDEYKHFLKYYEILFEGLSSIKIGQYELEAIAKDAVYNYDKYKFFSDVLEIIPVLHKRYKLAVVSDAWPSLEKVFEKAGMRDFFSAFVVSSLKGVNKPHELMYKTALRELEVLPEEAIFIDDSLKNCNGAAKLGIRSILLCRDIRLFTYHKFTCRNHRVIRNLRNINKFI